MECRKMQKRGSLWIQAYLLHLWRSSRETIVPSEAKEIQSNMKKRSCGQEYVVSSWDDHSGGYTYFNLFIF